MDMRKKFPCWRALKEAIRELGNGPVEAKKLFDKVKSKGPWTDDTVWQHLMSCVVNLPPAYRHWSDSRRKFLILREDGKYELYNREKHGLYKDGKRVSYISPILKEYNELVDKVKKYILTFLHAKPIKITEVKRSEYHRRPGAYVFQKGDEIIYVGSTNDIYRRLRHDLLGGLGQERPPHMFGIRLKNEFENAEEIRRYLKELDLKIIETETQNEAKVLEQILIYILKPKYNRS